MSVTDGQRTVAEFKIVGLSGVRGIGFSRLQFSLEVNVAGLADEPVRIHEPRGFVSVGSVNASPAPLGVAVPETQWFAETRKDATRSYFMIFLEVSGDQLYALESLRNGGPLIFRTDLHTLVESKSFGLQRSLVSPVWEVSISDWAKLLKDIGYTEILLVALELPVSGIPICFKQPFSS